MLATILLIYWSIKHSISMELNQKVCTNWELGKKKFLQAIYKKLDGKPPD